jgi:uncharacterized protein (DUF58 family)
MFDFRPQPEPREPGTAVPALAVLDRYLSMPLVFAALAAATFAIAWNRGIALIYVLFAILAGIALLSVLGPRWMLRAATLRFRLPTEASVGEPIPVGIAVEPGSRPAKRYFLRLDSPFPFAPAQAVFLSVSGSGHSREQRVRCAKRGVFELGEAAVSSAYPIGIFTSTRNWTVRPARITVFPRIHPVRRFPLPPGSARNSGELERPSPSVGQELIREVREYRAGDNPRHIHWRSSARRDRLMVKQFDAIATSETWIVLDLDSRSHDARNDSFERAVEIAATLASHLIAEGQRCGIAGGLAEDGSPRLLLAPKAGSSHRQAILYALAEVQPGASAGYAEVLSALAAQYRRGQQWILFDHDARRAVLPSFLRGDPVPLWFRFDMDSFAGEEPGAPAPAPPAKLADGFAIARGTDLSLLFR